MYEYTMNGPQVGFLGGPGQPVFPRLTPEQAAAMADLDTKQMLDWVMYDTKYFVAGTALPLTPINFFQVQIGQQDFAGNSLAITFQKTKFNTNMVQSGQLERGQVLIVRSMEAIVSTPGNFDLTNQATGNTTLPATLPTMAVQTNATAGVIVSNLESAILKSGICTLKVGNNFFENGPLIQFPSRFGISGYAGNSFTGTATAAVTTVPNDAISNNGFGLPRILIEPRPIIAGQNFQVILEFGNGFTPQRNFEIQFCLCGELYRDVS